MEDGRVFCQSFNMSQHVNIISSVIRVLDKDNVNAERLTKLRYVERFTVAA